MKVKISSLFLLCAVMILFTSCRTAGVYNVTDTAINTGTGQEPTLDQVEKAILGAATSSRARLVHESGETWSYPGNPNRSLSYRHV